MSILTLIRGRDHRIIRPKANKLKIPSKTLLRNHCQRVDLTLKLTYHFASSMRLISTSRRIVLVFLSGLIESYNYLLIVLVYNFQPSFLLIHNLSAMCKANPSKLMTKICIHGLIVDDYTFSIEPLKITNTILLLMLITLTYLAK